MPTILLIDDDELQLQLLRSMLMEEGYKVLATADGPQGIAMFRSNRVDLVLLDLGLPSMNGMDVLKNIKMIDPASKVIIVTATAAVESSVAAMQLGASDYIIKPVAREVLLKRVERALSEVTEE